jgi:surface protein
MKNKTFLFRLVVLVAAMMCALGASADLAYACYTPENTTLTFYYDIYQSTRPGTTYNLNEDFTDPGWVLDGTNANVTKVVFYPTFADARPTSTCEWFFGMRNLQSFTGLTNLNTSMVTNMYMMFMNCTGLTSLDLSSFNTSKVTTMASMFSLCTSLTSLDLSSFKTSNVTSMSNMFYNCNKLQTIYVGNDWTVATVGYSDGMFSNCTSLVGGKGTTYDANHIDKTYAHIDGGTSNPGYFTAAGTEAYACYTPSNTTLTFYHDNLRSSRTGTTYNLNTGANNPSWYTDGTYANVTRVVFDSSFAGARPTTTYYWFYEMQNLQTITGLSYLNTSEVNRMSYMFYGCNKFTSLDLSSFNTSKVTIMWAMFNNCTGLTSLDLSSFNTSQVTSMGYMFRNCSHLRTIYVGSDWSTAAVTQSTYMFEGCPSLVGGQGTTYDASHIDKAYAHIDGGTSNPGYFTAAGTEAYAVYTPENTTLTFYYDNQRDSRTGTTYNLNTGEQDTGWKTDGTNANVTRVVFDPSFAGARPTTTYLWFYLMRNLQTIEGIEYLNTSEVTNMAHMFNTCSSLTSLDLSSFNTSKVTEMRVMFCNCSSLMSLDLSSFNTSNVTNMFNIFGGCSSLTSLDLSSFNTSNVTDMGRMFYGCSRLTTVYVGEDWSTEAVTSSPYMFHNNNNLLGGQGTTYNASNPKDKTYAHIDGGTSNPGYFTAEGTEAYAVYTPENTTLTFYYDTQRSSRPGTTYDLNTGHDDTAWDADEIYANVTRVVFDPSFAGARPSTTFGWFYAMQHLQSIAGMGYLNTSEVTDMSHMFNGCSSLPSIDLSSLITSKVTNMYGMFIGCSSLPSLDLSNFNTSNVTDMTRMFLGCTNLTAIYAGDGWSTEAVTSSEYMFQNNNNLVGGMGTVYNDSNPKDKTYAHIDGGPSNPGYFTAAGTEAYAVFTPENTTLTFYYDTERDSRPGTTYDLNTGEDEPGWKIDDTIDYVTQVVFDPSFANARPTTTYSWFFGMQHLQSIEGMEYLNTSEVTSMRRLFAWCTELTSLDLSHFNTSKVTDMYGMFYGCTGLTSLDLSSFSTSDVTNMNIMFYNCSNLTTIYAGEEWSTEAVTNSSQMFNYDTSLVGGQGTTYDANHIDKAYAHIDGGPSNPGYFTDKNAGLRGDVDGDNNVSIDDVTALIDYLLGTNPDINIANADTDHSGDVSIDDVTTLIDYLLTGRWS